MKSIFVFSGERAYHTCKIISNNTYSMNALFSQLVRSDIGLDRGIVTEMPEVFSVRTQTGGPMTIFGLLFGIPGVLLLFLAFSSHDVVAIIAAIIFCPVLLGLAVLFGFSILEKRFNKSVGTFTRSLRVFGYVSEEILPLPTTGRIILKSENRGSSKAAPGSSIRYSIAVENCPGAGFALSKIYIEILAFAGRLSNFLGLPIENTVSEVHRFDR